MSAANVAQILWHNDLGKYSLDFRGKTLVKSAKIEYLEYLVRDKIHRKVREHDIGHYEVISRKPDGGPMIQIDDEDRVEVIRPMRPVFSINERFDMLDDLINMVINGNARSILLTGEGGVGKTHAVLAALIKAGKIDTRKAPKAVKPAPASTTVSTVDEEDEDDDTPFEERDPNEIPGVAVAKEHFENGDYVVMKGYSSAAGLYEFLYTYRDKMIICDDCDSVLTDGTAVNLLKAALDSYEERWITWNISSMAGSRQAAPSMFRFTGSIIFISNMNVRKINEAVRTRCHKVDVSMNNMQRIERMGHVIAGVMADVEMEFKMDALNLLNEYKDLTSNINFRSLMDTISIRKDPSVTDWRRLALFSLLDNN